MPPTQLVECFEPVSVHKAFYTGGNVRWFHNGEKILCLCGSSVKIIDVTSGKEEGSLGFDENNDDEVTEDLITTFCVSHNDENIVTAHKSGLLKLWLFKDLKMQWKSIHKGFVLNIAFNENDKLLATGGSDFSVRLWDMEHLHCIHNLTGLQGVVSVLKFYGENVFASGDDIIKGWNSNGNAIKTFSGHFSSVTGFDITPCGNYLVSCSRDKVMILWDFNTMDQIHVIPLYETVEGMVLLPEQITVPNLDTKLKGGIYVAISGELGLVRIWDAKNAEEIFVQKSSGKTAVTQLHHNRIVSLYAVVTTDHNIIFYNENFDCVKQLIGFSDEVLDIILLGEEENYMAVATNSCDIKLYELKTMNCQLLQGHTDLVVALGSTRADPNIFASASKDNSIKLWCLSDEKASCVATGLHGKSVTSINFSQTKLKFVLSGAQDTILKMWKFSKKESSLLVKTAQIAHEKDINSISVSPNDKLIATGSMDKTAKIWSDELVLLGTLRGHKRGIWSIQFSPVDQVVMTSSADTTIKIWSIADLSCLKTLEGHDSSVMKGIFINRGLQALTAGGDGLIKIWCLKTSECIASIDKHFGKIWALAITKNEKTIITGGSDSQLIIWNDVTEEKKLEEAHKRQEKQEMEQQLNNLLMQQDMVNALKFALTLERPMTVLKIVQGLLDDTRLEETVKQLDISEKQSLLDCAAHWNTNSKFCYPAQLLISILIDEIVTKKVNVSKHFMETFTLYTEKHFKRLTELTQNLNFIDYCIKTIKPTA